MRHTDKNEKINHVIFVTISMTGGGTERVIANLANHYVSIGVKTTILMIGGDDVAYELDDRVDIRCLSGRTGGSLSGRLGRIKAMRGAFKEEDGAVIIAMGTVASMFAVLANTGLKKRVIVSERNDPNRLNHRPIKSYEKMLRNMLYLRADKLVCQTPDAMESFPKCIRNKAVIIMNPLNETGVVSKAGYQREKIVMTAGRLTAQKNHKLLIDAFAKFAKAYPEYRLEIYGKGDMEEELREYIGDRNLSHCIKMCGFTDALGDRLSEAMMYVSSSDWEGISNSLMEALSSGIAVIATDCPMGGSRMLIEDGVNGRLVPVNNVDKLAEAMESLADSSSLWDKVSANAVRIRDIATVDEIAKQWLA